MENNPLDFPHTRTSLYRATQGLHLLAAGLERTADARLYVGELRRLTLRMFLGVVTAGMSPTARTRAQSLKHGTYRLAKIAGLLEIMAAALPTMAADVARARALCEAIAYAIAGFAEELASEEAQRGSATTATSTSLAGLAHERVDAGDSARRLAMDELELRLQTETPPATVTAFDDGDGRIGRTDMESAEASAPAMQREGLGELA